MAGWTGDGWIDDDGWMDNGRMDERVMDGWMMMDGWIMDGWMDGWMGDGWVDDDGWMDNGWMDEWMGDGWVDNGRMDERVMNGWVEWVYGWVGRWKLGWINKRTEEWMVKSWSIYEWRVGGYTWMELHPPPDTLHSTSDDYGTCPRSHQRPRGAHIPRQTFVGPGNSRLRKGVWQSAENCREGSHQKRKESPAHLGVLGLIVFLHRAPLLGNHSLGRR